MTTTDTTDNATVAYWASPHDTKAVRGMNKTANRRPDARNHVWSLCCPTLDVLFHRKWQRLANLRITRALRARQTEGGAS